MRNDITHSTLRLAPLLLGAMVCASAYAQTQDLPGATTAPTQEDKPVTAATQAAPAPQEGTPGVTPPAVAQQQKKEIAHGDPSRWYHNDSTAADQLKAVRKEIAAALQEATQACKQQPAAQRSACMKDARSTYQHDMVNAKVIRDENNRLQ